MCIVLYRHCPGCYGMKNNRRLNVEFCPKRLMMKRGWIPGRKARKSDDKPCTKALHYQEEHWRLETHQSHQHKPGLKGKLPVEGFIKPFSGRMADLEIVPTQPRAAKEKSQNKRPSKDEWSQCLVNLAFPDFLSEPQPERPSVQLRHEISYSQNNGLITPPSDSDGFNPNIPFGLEPWPDQPWPDQPWPNQPMFAEDLHGSTAIFEDSDGNESESELSELASMPASPPLSPPLSPPPHPTTPPVTKKRPRTHAKTLSLGKKMLNMSITNAKKTCKPRSKLKGKRKETNE